MTSLRYAERMAGFVTFGAEDPNDGLRRGRLDGTACAFDLQLEIPQVDAFLEDPERTAIARGTLECGALGGTLAVEHGRFNLLTVVGGDEHRRRMSYLLHLRDGEGRALTFSGQKDVADGMGLDIWSDTSTLVARLYTGHVDVSGEAPDVPLLATGILEISHPGFVRMLASMRPRGGLPWKRAAALARFQLAFAGTLAQVYGGRARREGRPDFPDPRDPDGDPFRGHEPGAWHEVDGHPGLRRRILPLRAGDGLELTLHHVRGDAEPTGAPVLCLHGVGVRADLFVGPPGGTSVAAALVAAGHDVWLLNWRASIELPPRPYTLDEGAVFDHPAAIAEVRRLTGSGTVRVLAQCQGATSFTITALSGLADDVTHVVAGAVSLHTVVPWPTRVKARLMLPVLALRLPYVSAQWGLRAPSALARGYARLARLIRRECDSPVCAVGSYTYGTGRDVLWVHERLGERAHEWISREFGFASVRFLMQMRRCTSAGHVVPVLGLPAVPRDLRTAALPPGQRWTFLAGTRNRLYLPAGQRRSHAHFGGDQAGHTLHLLEGYGHLDPLLGTDAATDVFPQLLAGLAD